MNNGGKIVGDRVAQMAKKRSEKVVGILRFMKLYPKNESSPFCVVEGEDAKYYKLRVKIKCNNIQPIFIQCNGKDKVIETYKWIKSKPEYDEGKIMYFVDKDFDESYGNPLIYETPFHSIENFYTTEEAVANILRDTFTFDDMDEHFNIAMNLFRKCQEEFHESIKLLNVWLMCQADANRKEQVSTLNLRNVKIDDFVSMSLDSVTSKYNLETLVDKFPDAIIINQDIIGKLLEEIDGENYQEIFRGKFEIQFLVKFLNLIRQDVGKKKPMYFPKRVGVNLAIYDVIDQFSKDASTPDCLCNYLDHIWLGEKVVV
ncbi:DUF4435 domain-containing protein [Bacillus toyonensis]|uniref:DUF4435 domain-containing protein n=2 Tax=Bacillus cereus group TaxID=86661 RepID=UPI000BF776D7|nr:DUF4435 domain-containing protein [Bacillus toyonensis]PGE68216.1 hypothetical protein COM69_15135 [Bacillus toyonensis]PHD44983.1 hypothetical protein COF65_05860 [Bacillus toyonensis]